MYLPLYICTYFSYFAVNERLIKNQSLRSPFDTKIMIMKTTNSCELVYYIYVHMYV